MYVFGVFLNHRTITFKLSLYYTGAECGDGTYGYNCVNNCSGHCLNNSLCNKQTGHCDRGCNPGYANSDCSKSKLFTYLIIWCEKRQ